MKNIVCVLMLVFMASSLHANEIYMASTKIHENEILLGSPSLAAQSKTEVSVTKGKKYSLKLTIDPMDGNIVLLTTSLTINGVHMAPSFLVELGKESTVKSGDKRFSVVVIKS